MYQGIKETTLADTKVAAINSMDMGTFNYFLPKSWDLGIVIDYVFVQASAFHVANYYVPTEYEFKYQSQQLPASDHYPVVTDLFLLKHD